MRRARRTVLTRLVPVCGSILAATVAAQPVAPRDAPAARAAVGTAAITGTITSSGQPVADARVLVSAPELPGGRSALTDERGRFAIGSLPPGRHRVAVSKNGYVQTMWGQRRPRGSARTILLADGERREITIDLPRAGVITGLVVNDRGEAMVGVGVQALHVASQGGERRFQQVGGTATDDRGIYRIHSLQPGDYIVCATPENHDAMSDAQRLRRDLQMMRTVRVGPVASPEAARKQLDERIAQLEAQLGAASGEPVRGYGPSCVPGYRPDGAVIAVAPGDERHSVDLRLERTPLAAIEGTIVAPPGIRPEHVMIMLSARHEALPFSGRGVMQDDQGRFSAAGLAPGDYRLQARTRPAGSMTSYRVGPQGAPTQPDPGPAVPPMYAELDVHVDGTDVTDLTLELQSALTISGEVVFEGTSRPRPRLTALQVGATPFRLTPFRPVLAEPAQGTVDESGRFTIAGVMPGTYRLGTGADGWGLHSVMAGDRDVLDFPLEIGSGQHVTGVVITLTDRLTEIAGTVTDSRGKPALDHSIAIFPADSRYWTTPSRRMRLIPPGPDGRFAFRGLPAGEYRLATLLDFDMSDWASPEHLEQLSAGATTVTLRDGERKEVALRARPD